MKYEELMVSVGSAANKSLLIPSVEAFRRLLLKNGADLTNVPTFNLSDVVRWGHPLIYIPDDVFDSGLFSNAGNAFLTKGRPNANEFAEIQEIGLLGAGGANIFSTVQRTNNKTNAFIFTWGNSQVEVEVTKASEKDEHVKRRTVAEKLTDDLFELNRQFDLIVDVSYGLSKESIARLVSAARYVQLGETISEENAWCIAGKPVDRVVGEIFKAGEVDARPDWWAKDDIQLFCLKAMIACPADKEAALRVRVRFAARFNGYLNAAKRKAGRFQGSGTLPYLIVLDANDLPNPFEAFAEGLLTHFPKWKHISGVLVFVDWRSHDEIGWTWRMFENPHAARPLPAEMKDKMPFSMQPMNVVIRFNPDM